MFLSRIEIPWEAARNSYEIHRRIWRLFPGEERESRKAGTENRQGFLFRVEDKQVGRPARALVQSRLAPQAEAGVTLLGTREFSPKPAEGMQLAFVLTANPVKTIADKEREAKPGKQSEKCRVPLIAEADQLAWLKRKLEGAATVNVATVLKHPPLGFRKSNYAGKLSTVTYEGTLTVTDPHALAFHLENGVGPAKAFGCGLLLVRRVE